LCEENGYPISGLQINAFLRDWSQLNAMRYEDYPKHRFFSVNVPLWSKEQRKIYIVSRIEDHSHGLRECTPKEKWQKETTYAVKKKGVSTARRVLGTDTEARQWMEQQKGTDLYIEERPGECTRCKLYCPVREVCKYNTTREGDNVSE